MSNTSWNMWFLKIAPKNVAVNLKLNHENLFSIILALLAGINDAGQLTPELEDNLKGVISDFLATYTS